ncbi:exported hypothetical protein [Gammaproteobacteria bacterium]
MPFVERVVTCRGLCPWVLTGLLLAAGPLGAAEEVRVYNSPPSVDEVRQALFPEIAAASGTKTRSIHMIQPATSLSPATAPEISQTETPASTSSHPTPVVIAVPIRFAHNSSEIEDDQMALLDPIGKMMAADSASKSRLIVEGYTDDEGSPAQKRKLSRQRAEAAKQYLVTQYDIDPKRLTAVGKGQNKSLARNERQNHQVVAMSATSDKKTRSIHMTQPDVTLSPAAASDASVVMIQFRRP